MNGKRTIFQIIDDYGLTGNVRDLETVIYRLKPGSEHIMFLMQNPGGDKISKREKRAHREITKLATKEHWDPYQIALAHVERSNEFLLEWLKGRSDGRPKKFYEGFQKIFQKVHKQFKGISDNKIFWEQFYITDYVKRRMRTRVLKDNDFSEWQRVLKWEIKNLKKLKLIIIFGTRTWDNFRNKIDKTLEPIGDGAKVENSVTDAHGYLFRSRKHKYFVMPLVHMSHQPFQNALRNSYFDYMEEGLRSFYKYINN